MQRQNKENIPHWKVYIAPGGQNLRAPDTWEALHLFTGIKCTVYWPNSAFLNDDKLVIKSLLVIATKVFLTAYMTKEVFSWLLIKYNFLHIINFQKLRPVSIFSDVNRFAKILFKFSEHLQAKPLL